MKRRRGTPAARTRALADVLFAQGFGTRHECMGLVLQGRVRVAAQVVDDPAHEVSTDALVIEVDGSPWACHDRALVMLHKPAGVECSRSPRHHLGVMSLLPAPLRRRGVQPVGRLDEDTTGLLLLTDDGALLHRLTSPRHHVPKVYEVATREAVTDAQVARLLEGVVLDDDPRPAVALACERTGGHALRLTLTEGRYHQVKRMLAAVGNAVTGLHRSRIGALELPGDLAPGQWRWLTADDERRLARAGAPADQDADALGGRA